MARYIDANKIKLTGLTFSDVNNEVYFSLSDVRKAIEQTPTADVVEVRYGHWQVCSDEYEICADEFVCSCCKESFVTSELTDEQFLQMMKYCPYCGAKMDGERKEQKVTAESAIKALHDAAHEFRDVAPDAHLGLMIGSTMQY